MRKECFKCGRDVECVLIETQRADCKVVVRIRCRDCGQHLGFASQSRLKGETVRTLSGLQAMFPMEAPQVDQDEP